jgi:hypothetical protein
MARVAFFVVAGFLLASTAQAIAQVRDLPNVTVPQPLPKAPERLPDARNIPGVRVPEPAQAAPSPAQAARIHRNSSGEWVPDNGCHWLNNDPDDLRVRCD